MARTIEHYRRLGFTFSAAGSPDVGDAEFAIAERDGVELHFALKRDHDPSRTAAWLYLRVEDADELAAEFAAAGTEPQRAVHDTEYHTREFALIDPDGNLLLFGSRQPDAPAGSPPAPPGSAAGPKHRHEPSALEFATALKRGDADRVRELLADDPYLATAVINGYRPLHLFADAPGHRPNATAIVAALVAAGADLDAHAIGTWHHETALHWAASNDDVALIDVLLDSGADIEHPGSSIGGGPPSQSAVGYAQWAALRRLHERGAEINLAQSAALGLMPLVTSFTEGVPPPGGEEISLAFWNACRAGQLPTARYLLARGADLNWPAPWSGETPLDAAQARHQHEMAAWLAAEGAISGG
jgi:ankyrin repeat protein